MRSREEALGKRPDFNEVLSIGNYPNQHMNYHSDGEKNVVGNVFASLSPGSLGIVMKIHKKPKDTANEIAGLSASFNEIITIGDYPNQLMTWHSDGEDSVIGYMAISASLAAPAQMSFALQNKYMAGKYHKSYEAPLVAGCLKETEKRDLESQLENGELTDEKFRKK